MQFSILRIFTVLVVLFNLVSLPVFAEQPPAIETAVVETLLIDLSSMDRIGEMTTGGVIASAYIKTIDAHASIEQTHRIVVTFVNEKSGVSVAKALVGIKHRKLFGATSEPVWMKSSNVQPELYAVNISLKQRGTYLFIVGSKLEDDKKRQFTFQYQR